MALTTSTPTLVRATPDLVLASDLAAVEIHPGQSKRLTLTVTNSGTGTATPVTLGATLPQNVVVDSASGCRPAGADPLPCSISSLAPAATAKVTVDLVMLVPDPLPDASGCPAAGTAMGDATLTVATPLETHKVDNDATVALTTGPYADLATTIEGPAGRRVEGDVISFTTAITNNGPCDAVDAIAAPVFALRMPLQSATGACTEFPHNATTDQDECALGTLALGQTVTFVTTHRIDTYPREVEMSVVRADVTASSSTWDPIPANDTATHLVPVDATADEGCSSAAGGGAMALLSLLSLAFLRRRRDG